MKGVGTAPECFVFRVDDSISHQIPALTERFATFMTSVWFLPIVDLMSFQYPSLNLLPRVQQYGFFPLGMCTCLIIACLQQNFCQTLHR